MKPVLLSTLDGNGGAAISAWRLMESLQQAGVDARMLVQEKHQSSPWSVSAIEPEAWRPWLSLRDLLLNGWIGPHRTPLTNTFFACPQFGVDLAGHPLVREADVINLHWVEGFQSVQTVARLGRLGKPIVWTLHDMAPLSGGCHYSAGCNGFETDCAQCPQLQPPLHFLTERVLAHKRRAWSGLPLYAVAPSRWLAGVAERSGLFAKGRVFHIPYSLNLEKFTPLDGTAIRAALGLEKETVYLAFGASAREQRKGFPQLLEAMRLLHEKGAELGLPPDCKIGLLAFGDPIPLPPEVSLPIRFLGPVREDQVPSILAACDLFLSPTLEDNLPNTILEALACGRPVVAFATGGVPDMIEDGVNGYLAPTGDVRALAKAMARACKDRAWREQAGRAGRAKAEKEYAPAVQAARYQACFKEVAAAAAIPTQESFPPTAILMDEKVLHIEELIPLIGKRLHDFGALYSQAVAMQAKLGNYEALLVKMKEQMDRQMQLLVKEREKARHWEEQYRTLQTGS